MATSDDVITIAELRGDIGLSSEEDDARLSAYRSAAISLVEKWTDRVILDRTGQRFGGRLGRLDGCMLFNASDVVQPSTLDIRYRPSSSRPGAARTATVSMSASEVTDKVMVGDRDVMIYAPDDGWPSMSSIPYPEATFSQGIAAAHIPDPWKIAVSFLAREMYEGNMLDSIPRGSFVSVLLRPWTLTLTDR